MFIHVHHFAFISGVPRPLKTIHGPIFKNPCSESKVAQIEKFVAVKRQNIPRNCFSLLDSVVVVDYAEAGVNIYLSSTSFYFLPVFCPVSKNIRK